MSKILVVQDEEMNQDNLLRRLIRRGFEVHAVVELEEGLKQARSAPFDLILLDMNLADMDGWDAARKMREDPATQASPIIGMCNNELDGAEAMARDAGCVDFEQRPVDLDRLIGKIHESLKAKNA